MKPATTHVPAAGQLTVLSATEVPVGPAAEVQDAPLLEVDTMESLAIALHTPAALQDTPTSGALVAGRETAFHPIPALKVIAAGGVVELVVGWPCPTAMQLPATGQEIAASE